MTLSSGPIEELQTKLGSRFESIQKARESSADAFSKLGKALAGQDSDATSIVTYGSLGRGEWTSGSDLDWTLLIDGGVDPQHAQAVARITEVLEKEGWKRPGGTKTFAGASVSHHLVHKIGGQEDTNQNTTRRILLLFESRPVGKRDAYARVKRHVLDRYVEEDWGLSGGSSAFVPRFLLNDVVRYWRTMAVDFAQKQHERGGEGWGIRNAKLRMSRKLLFTSGLLICLRCELDTAAKPARTALREIKPSSPAPLLEYLESQLMLTPVEMLAKACLELNATPATVTRLLGSYDRFLTILDDPEKRGHLEKLKREGFNEDPLFAEARGLSHEFQEGLTELFFQSNTALAKLTMKYGVF